MTHDSTQGSGAVRTVPGLDAMAAVRAAHDLVGGEARTVVLPEALRHAQRAAVEAADAAFAPYSGLAVGVALVARDGRVVLGCNVESASYGLTQCAERAALATARVARVPAIELVVLTSSAGPIPPCGACRQVLLELAPDAVVVSVGAEPPGGGAVTLRVWAVSALLPDAFDGSELRRDV